MLKIVLGVVFVAVVVVVAVVFGVLWFGRI